MSGPVFIAGPSRSGKTLMRWILSSHPNLVVTRRTEMWPRFAGRFGDLAERENLERCLAAMMARSQIASLEPDLDRLRRDLRAGEPTYARLFALVHEQVAERAGKPRWGDQSPGNERFADEVISAYPGARFLHLVRDPRDAYAGLLEEKASRRPGAAGPWVASWLTSVELARGNARRYPSAYRVVQYETLVAEPERTMRAICDAIGETFDPAMLRLDGVERYRDGDGAGPISTRFVGRFRAVLSPTDLAYIQSVAGTEMRSLGYPPEPIRWNAADRIRFATAWPALRTRARLQHVRDERQRSAAGRSGR